MSPSSTRSALKVTRRIDTFRSQLQQLHRSPTTAAHLSPAQPSLGFWSADLEDVTHVITASKPFSRPSFTMASPKQHQATANLNFSRPRAPTIRPVEEGKRANVVDGSMASAVERRKRAMFEEESTVTKGTNSSSPSHHLRLTHSLLRDTPTSRERFGADSHITGPRQGAYPCKGPETNSE